MHRASLPSLRSPATPANAANPVRKTAATPVQYEADSRKDDIRLFAVVFASVAIFGSGIFAIVILSRRHFSL
jgi:hypothetical protein